jgi:type VI secretion system secreted protein VgrG
MDATSPSIVQNQDDDLVFTFSASGAPEAGFVVRSFEAREGVSVPYRIEIELASRRDDIDPVTLIDRPGVLTIHDRYGQPRYLDGIVMSSEYGDN